jgi:hypothetical protein
MPKKNGKDSSRNSYYKKVLIGLVILVLVVYAAIILSQRVYVSANLAPCDYLFFKCSNVVLNSSGEISFSLSFQNTGTLYNLSLGCAAKTGQNGFPYVLTPNASTNSTGMTPAKNLGAYNNTVTSNETLHLSGLICYGPNGLQIGPNATHGTSLNATLWLKYNSKNSAAGIIQRIPMGTINVS